MLACPPLEVNACIWYNSSWRSSVANRFKRSIRSFVAIRRSLLPSVLLERHPVLLMALRWVCHRYVCHLLLLRFLFFHLPLEIIFGDFIIFIRSGGACHHSDDGPTPLEVVPLGVSDDGDYAIIVPSSRTSYTLGDATGSARWFLRRLLIVVLLPWWCFGETWFIIISARICRLCRPFRRRRVILVFPSPPGCHCFFSFYCNSTPFRASS